MIHSIWRMQPLLVFYCLLFSLTSAEQICKGGSCAIYTCGAPGIDGVPGINGKNGLQGDKGDTGLPGSPGIAGPAGPQGQQGPPGQRGEKGESDAAALKELKEQISTLNGKLNSLQSKTEQQRKALSFFKGAAATSDKIYVSKGEEATYSDAKAVCSKAGGQLPSPRNAKESEAVHEIAKQYALAAFLGINDIQTKGTFRYPNGQAISYSNWKDNEPNDLGGEEDCVEMYYETGKWNDQKCAEKHLVICEF